MSDDTGSLHPQLASNQPTGLCLNFFYKKYSHMQICGGGYRAFEKRGWLSSNIGTAPHPRSLCSEMHSCAAAQCSSYLQSAWTYASAYATATLCVTHRSKRAHRWLHLWCTSHHIRIRQDANTHTHTHTHTHPQSAASCKCKLRNTRLLPCLCYYGSMSVCLSLSLSLSVLCSALHISAFCYPFSTKAVRGPVQSRCLI